MKNPVPVPLICLAAGTGSGRLLAGITAGHFAIKSSARRFACSIWPRVILLEKMAAGLPIASSNRGPMPEILGDAGVYFDPEQPESIAASLINLINSIEFRGKLAQAAFDKAGKYSWEHCARNTFDFLVEIEKEYTDLT